MTTYFLYAIVVACYCQLKGLTRHRNNYKYNVYTKVLINELPTYRIAGNNCVEFNIADCSFLEGSTNISSAIFLSPSHVYVFTEVSTICHHVVVSVLFAILEPTFFIFTISNARSCLGGQQASQAKKPEWAVPALKRPKTSHYNCSPKDRARIGKYAAEHSPAKAVRHFSLVSRQLILHNRIH